MAKNEFKIKDIIAVPNYMGSNSTVNSVLDCRSWSRDERCIPDCLPVIQVVVIVAAIILNSIIISTYIRKRHLRERIPNLLLVNQAVADMFNAAVFGVTLESVMLRHIDRAKKFMSWTLEVCL